MIGKWKDQFLEGGRAGLGAAKERRGPTGEEARLRSQVDELTHALGEAHVELRLAKRGGAGRGGAGRGGGVSHVELELIRLDAGLSISRFCAVAGIHRSTWHCRAARAREQRESRWPAPERDRIEQPAAQLALEWPAWGTARSGRFCEPTGCVPDHKPSSCERSGGAD